MTKLSKKECGILLALTERFKEQRLPRLLALKEKVDNGNVLSNMDIDFLQRVIEDANRTKPLALCYPEIHKFCAHAVNYYNEITKKALENEKKRS